MSIVVAILVLSLLVFFHELGHFIVARICGVGVEVFSVGFGRKLVGVKIGGTEYRISLIPLGGYVKLLEDTNSSLSEGNSAFAPFSRFYEREASSLPLEVTPSSALTKSQKSSQNPRIAGDSKTTTSESHSTSESTASDSHSISESASHTNLESNTDSETPSGEVYPLRDKNEIARSADLEASSGRGDCQGGRERLRNSSPSPLDEKENTIEEVKKISEAKAKDSKKLDLESKRAISADSESMDCHAGKPARNEDRLDSQSIDCHDFASATSHNNNKTETNPHASTKSPADSRIISAQAKCAPYTSKPPLTRIAILLAGPAFNFLLAFLLYLAVGAGGVMSLLPVVGEVKPHSAAARAGVQKGDVIESINGAPLRTWAELDRAIVDSKGALELSIRRGGQSLSLSLTPEISQARNAFNERITRKMIGIASAGVVSEVAYRGLDVLRYACAESLSAATLIAQGFVKLVSGVVPSSELGGVVSIVSVIGSASEDSLTRLLWLTALISVNLGVLNLLPIPALDGGHIVFNLYELITRKAPNERIMHYLTLCGWAILLSLMFLGLYNDIFRLLG